MYFKYILLFVLEMINLFNAYKNVDFTYPALV